MAEDTFVGKNLGQYEILSLLGRGLFSSVYRAYQASLNRTVAVKVLPADLLRDEHFQERFEQDVRVLRQLEHFHVLPIYDVGQAERRPYLVMRYVAGGTLGNLLARYGMLSVAETVPIIQQVASALDYAHQRGILHRGLKPSNVLLDEEANAYLSDFSINRVREGIAMLTGSGIYGGVGYSSPEVLSGARIISHAADVYSLGVLLFQMLTGQLPFQGDSTVETARMIAITPPPAPRTVNPDLSQVLEDVILKALAKDPADRHDSAGALAAALSKAAGIRTDSVRRGLPPADETGTGPYTPPKPPTAPTTPPAARMEADSTPTPVPGSLTAPPGVPTPPLSIKRSGGTPPPEGPPPGGAPPPGKARIYTTPVPGSMSAVGTGPISWESITQQERRQLERAAAQQRRKQQRRGGGGFRWYTALLAFLLVVVAWFVIGILAGQQIQRQQQEAASTQAASQPTPSPSAELESATATEETSAAVEPTATVPTATEVIAAPPDTPTPTVMPTATPTPLGASLGLLALVSERDGDPEIFLLDVATLELRQITRNTVEDDDPAWSVDGSMLAFSSAETRAGVHIFVMSADGSDLRELTQSNRVDESPLWSPDGARVAFHSVEAGRSFIRAATLSGEEETLAQIPTGDNHLFDWSADGQQLTYFGYSPAGTQEIVRLDLLTDDRVPLTQSNRLVNFVDFSADGSKVVFTQFINARQRQVYVADNDPVCRVITDCNTIRLTSDEFDYQTPHFSPDGTLIVVSSNQAGNFDLYLLDLEGSVVQQLTDSQFDEYDAVWQP
jgi:serine/threonine protein kinase